MVKRKFLGSLLSAGVMMWLYSPMASAADLPSMKAPPATAPAPFTWTGLYVGADFAYSWTDDRWIDVASANVFDRTFFNWGPLRRSAPPAQRARA